MQKLSHTLRNEGLLSVLDRSSRYAMYRVRRMLASKRDTIEEWQRLKGLYEGQRAFLIGNGPSLNRTELYLLEHESTMCFNRFDLILERLSWAPTFYTVIDDRVLLDTLPVVHFLSSLAQHSFFPDIHPYNVDFRGRIRKRDYVHWLFLDRPDFSAELPYCGINKTVANVGLQILAYLGFSEIYLLGVDMTYALPKSVKLGGARNATATEDDDESHFDPRYFGKGRAFHVPMLQETFIKFREARQFLGERNVKVMNATVGGCLEEFERTALDEVLGVTREEKKAAFSKLVRSKLRDPSFEPLESLRTLPRIERPEDVRPETEMFRVSTDRVNAFVMKHVTRFVPFGPLDEQVLFVSRARLAPPGWDDRHYTRPFGDSRDSLSGLS